MAMVLMSRWKFERKDPVTGLMRSWVPLQNTNGNVIGLADDAGKLVEKVKYTPYGLPTFVYDHEPPKVDQVRVVSAKINIRFSEPVELESARQAVGFKKGSETIPGTLESFDEGRLMVFTPGSPLSQNQAYTVIIKTDLTDLSGNKLANEFSQGFVFTNTDVVIYDRKAPAVQNIVEISRNYYVEFDEEIDPTSLSGGCQLSWGSGNDSGTMTGTNTLDSDNKTVVFTPAYSYKPATSTRSR